MASRSMIMIIPHWHAGCAPAAGVLHVRHRRQQARLAAAAGGAAARSHHGRLPHLTPEEHCSKTSPSVPCNSPPAGGAHERPRCSGLLRGKLLSAGLCHGIFIALTCFFKIKQGTVRRQCIVQGSRECAAWRVHPSGMVRSLIGSAPGQGEVCDEASMVSQQAPQSTVAQEDTPLYTKLKAVASAGTLTLSPVTAAALSGAFLPGLLPSAWAGQAKIRCTSCLCQQRLLWSSIMPYLATSFIHLHLPLHQGRVAGLFPCIMLQPHLSTVAQSRRLGLHC